MEKYIAFVIVGIVLVGVGILNYRGNISSIHWYNRRKVSEADIPSYGRCMGIGSMVCGGALLLTAMLEILLKNPMVEITILLGFAIGLVFLLYGQFKYNKGLF